MERVPLGRDDPRTLDEVCDPRPMALVVYDMQVGVVSQLSHGPEITARVAGVPGAAREGASPCFQPLHVAAQGAHGCLRAKAVDGLAARGTTRGRGVAFPSRCPHTELVPELAPLAGEAVRDKISMSAFEGTFLNMAVRDLGVQAFAIVGIATEIGIEPTVRHGADPGYEPVIVTDACGAGNEEAAHHYMEVLGHAGDAFFTEVATISSLLRGTT